MSLINAGLQEFKALYDLGKNAYTKARARIATPLRVEKLADDVFSSRIEFGKVVTVQGKLSRYGLTYKPLTYAQRIGAPCKVTDDGGFQTRFQPFQYPVQTLPTLKGENDEYCIAFLYSNNFNGFILQDDPAKDLSIDTHVLLVEPQHRAIPILLSANDLQNTSEREVTLTGVVSLLPDALIKTVVNTLCPTREALYYHFLRTSSPHAGFCIDCRREENSDFNVKNRLRDIHGALYVEGHFEGVADDRYEKEYKASVPKGAWTNTVVSGLGFTVPSAPGIVFYLSLDKNVSLVRKGAGTFGFYTQTNLIDMRDYNKKFNHLREFYKEFHKNVTNRIRQAHSCEVRFKPDFMFDFSKQVAFHPDGVLSSKSAEQTLHDHPELKETADWLRK